jgi:multisubunit Na+/H+ antiporter MnhB subunit
VERAAPLVLDLAALALLALALVVGRFPQRRLRELVVALVVAVAVVALFLARALALASPRPAMAAPDSATE